VELKKSALEKFDKGYFSDEDISQDIEIDFLEENHKL
jgi:hypothetical protein